MSHSCLCNIQSTTTSFDTSGESFFILGCNTDQSIEIIVFFFPTSFTCEFSCVSWSIPLSAISFRRSPLFFSAFADTEAIFVALYTESSTSADFDSNWEQSLFNHGKVAKGCACMFVSPSLHSFPFFQERIEVRRFLCQIACFWKMLYSFGRARSSERKLLRF